MNAIPQPEEFRKPWFRVVSVSDIGGRSIADIAAEVCEKHGISMAQMRGESRAHHLGRARREAYEMVRRERPDLSSGRAAIFFRRDGSTLRHVWREMEDA